MMIEVERKSMVFFAHPWPLEDSGLKKVFQQYLFVMSQEKIIYCPVAGLPTAISFGLYKAGQYMSRCFDQLSTNNEEEKIVTR